MISYGFKGFKAFKKFPKIQLKPINVLCGTNSCGKTSYLQSLLLQVQTATDYSSRRPIELKLMGDLTRLGEWDDLCFKTSEKIETKDKPKEITFTYSIFSDCFQQKHFKQEYHRVLNMQKRTKILSSRQEIFEELSRYSTLKSFEWEIKLVFHKKCKEEPIRLSKLVFNSSIHGELIKSWSIETLSYKSRGIIKIKKAGVNCYDFKDDSEIDVRIRSVGIPAGFTNRWVFFDRFEPVNKSDHLEKSKTLTLRNFCPEYYISSNYILALLRKIRFIGPLREPPRRMYQFERYTDLDIGVKGEYSLQVLVSESKKKIPSTLLPINHKKHNTDNKIELLTCLNVWLNIMGLPEISLREFEVPYLSVYSWELNQGIFKGLLPDVGFGVSQILPILIEALRMEKEEILILEQPEIHLHPSLQSKLAEFILNLAKANRFFIIETHSEHFINRLCLRSARARGEEVSKLLNILFITNDGSEKGSQIKPVKISPYGEPENWPKGFFDDTDAGAIINAGIEKRMKEKNAQM